LNRTEQKINRIRQWNRVLQQAAYYTQILRCNDATIALDSRYYAGICEPARRTTAPATHRANRYRIDIPNHTGNVGILKLTIGALFVSPVDSRRKTEMPACDVETAKRFTGTDTSSHHYRSRILLTDSSFDADRSSGLCSAACHFQQPPQHLRPAQYQLRSGAGKTFTPALARAELFYPAWRFSGCFAAAVLLPSAKPALPASVSAKWWQRRVLTADRPSSRTLALLPPAPNSVSPEPRLFPA
jgi:hypothetical protein